MPQVLIRPSTPADLAAVTEIYGWNVRHGTGTFELDPPDQVDMARRRDDVLAKGLPWLVLEHDGVVRGYAYANQFRPRPAYRFCLEDSVYLAGDATGRGFGRLLLAELLARCEAAGARQMLAVIGDSGQRRLDRRAPRPRLRPRRHDRGGGLEVRSLARRRRHAAQPRRRRGDGSRMSAAPPAAPARSKTVATWLALLGGSLGLHRFYLFGLRDPWAWLHPWPTLVGAYGFWRMRTWGVDDARGSALVPLLGIMLAATMLQAIVYGLTSDERWAARHGARPGGAPAWPLVLAVDHRPGGGRVDRGGDDRLHGAALFRGARRDHVKRNRLMA